MLNIRRFLDMPQVVAMAAENSQVVIYDANPEKWKYANNVAEKLGWDRTQLRLRKPPAKDD